MSPGPKGSLLHLPLASKPRANCTSSNPRQMCRCKRVDQHFGMLEPFTLLGRGATFWAIFRRLLGLCARVRRPHATTTAHLNPVKTLIRLAGREQHGWPVRTCRSSVFGASTDLVHDNNYVSIVRMGGPQDPPLAIHILYCKAAFALEAVHNILGIALGLRKSLPAPTMQATPAQRRTCGP